MDPGRARTPAVGSVMTRALIVLDHRETLRRALELLHRHDIRHLPVVEQGLLVGMLSDRDLLSYQPPPGIGALDAAAYDALLDAPATAVMRPNVVTVGPDERLSRVIDLLVDLRIGAVPVIDGDRLVGIVTTIDVLEFFRQSSEE
ncbi:MAG: CBS domain-containing protein [Nannocystaceae bacterium]